MHNCEHVSRVTSINFGSIFLLLESVQEFCEHHKIWLFLAVIVCGIVITMVKGIDQVQSSNLPTRPAMFVGRENHLDDVVATVLNTETRIIVISGGPGVGKSTLAVTAGYELIGRRNVFYVSLDGITNIRDGVVRISTVLGLNTKTEKYYEHSLRIWAKTLYKETVLILDNTDDVTLQECQERTDFIKFFSSLVKQCVDNSGQSRLSIIVTSRFQIVTPDPPSHEVHLKILSQHDAEEYMRHFVPHLSHSQITELANVTGHVPLAILILGTLTKSLSPSDVDKVIVDAKSDPIDVYSPETFGEQQLDRCISVSFRYLNSSEIHCFVSVSLLPGTFDDAASNFIITNLTRDTKCTKKLLSRSLVEKVGSGRYGMHPFLQKYSLKHMQEGAIDLQNHFKILFIEHYISLMSSSIQSAKAKSDVKGFYLILSLEHHNFLFLLMQLTQSDIDVPLNILLPFVLDTFEIVRNNFPEVVVDWWLAVAKAGFASLQSQDSCTVVLELFVQFILSIADILNSFGQYNFKQLETLLLELDSLLNKAGNCSKTTLVNFYQKMDTFYYRNNCSDKWFPYLKKIQETLGQDKESGKSSSVISQHETLIHFATQLRHKGRFEDALHYLERAQSIHYSFVVAKAQVAILFSELFKVVEAREVAHDAVMKFDSIVQTEAADKKLENGMEIAEMFHMLADYETEEMWLTDAYNFLVEASETGIIQNYDKHVEWFLHVAVILVNKGETQKAIKEAMTILKHLRSSPGLPKRDEFLCEIVKSLGDLHHNVGENDDAKVYYEEALQLCALANSKSVNFDVIKLHLISIDITNLNLKSATWKLGLLVGSLPFKLLQEISSWLTTTRESSSNDPTIPRGLSAGTTDAAVVTGIYFPSGVKLWMEYLYNEYTKLEVVAVIMTKVQFKANLQHIFTTTFPFFVFISCNWILFGIYLKILWNIPDFWLWLEGMERCTYVLYCMHTSPVVLLILILLLAGKWCLMLYFRVMILASWLLYIFVRLPRKLLDPQECYHESFSFTEYCSCLHLALSDREGSHEGSPISVYKHVKLLYFRMIIIYFYVSVIILLVLTSKCVWYLEFLLEINSLIIYILYTVVCYGIKLYISK